ncbi:MAG: protein kinase [Bacteroidales bacterium]|nr:protein kinase [Bacteroidales bacterium]
METASPLQLMTAVKESGLYKPEQLAAAERIATTAPDTPACAEGFYTAGVLTKYQYQKIRAGRVEDLLFGPYLILDRIGEGGMGKVYRAVQRKVGKIVAIKMVRPQLLTNRMVISRYKREARAAAKLDHPNIVSLFDADDVNGRYFLAMEYVDGIDLSRMVKQFGNPPNTGLADYHEAAEYVRQAALGLQHAHEHGLVHRDIKPSNMLVFGERPLFGTAGKATVKILDMGLVRSILESEDVSRTELTRDGTVVGTPDYMAPEQAKNSSTVDARADLYSLGCTLYFLIRGQSPFPEGSPIDKLIRHQLDPPPNLRIARPDVPDGLVAIIDKLLKKNPVERYQTASAVAQALLPFTTSAGATPPAEQVLGNTDETVAFPQISLEPGPPTDSPVPMTPPAPIKTPNSGSTPRNAPTSDPAVPRPRSDVQPKPAVVVETPPVVSTTPPDVRGTPSGVRLRPPSRPVNTGAIVDAEVVTPPSAPRPVSGPVSARHRKPTSFRERKINPKARRNHTQMIWLVVVGVIILVVVFAMLLYRAIRPVGVTPTAALPGTNATVTNAGWPHAKAIAQRSDGCCIS